MTIVFIPNDPEASNAPPPRRIKALAARKRGKTDFDFGRLPEQKPWPVDSAEFRVWQARETLLRALGMWEKIAGPLKHWQGDPKRRKLHVNIDEGADLNAYYDRKSLGYYHYRSKVTKETRYFAASADVVSHEAGHAFLDALRPELWDSNFPEPNAFHEAFGDCVALLTALSDEGTRRTLLLHDPKLTRKNFVETLIESLANGIRDYDPKHNGARPRHGFNTYQWVLPSTLPDSGGPGVLINEIHSFGQVFVGCFYDVIRNIFAMEEKGDQKTLRDSALRAGQLLVRAAEKAPHTPRFFQAIGRAMTLEDEYLHAGKNHDAIRRAFKRHGILLGSVAAIAPRAELKGKAPQQKHARGGVAAETLTDLRSRLGISSRAALRMRSFSLGGQQVHEAVHERAVPLKGLSSKLANVVARGSEPSLIGAANRRAALLGTLPDTQTTHDEVRSFVASLVRQGAITYAGTTSMKKRGRSAVATPGMATHAIVRENGQQVLMRLRFACGCCVPRIAAKVRPPRTASA